MDGAVGTLLELFRPRSFDLVRWERGASAPLPEVRYSIRTRVAQELASGYRVQFVSYYRPQARLRAAIELRVAPRELERS